MVVAIMFKAWLVLLAHALMPGHLSVPPKIRPALEAKGRSAGRFIPYFDRFFRAGERNSGAPIPGDKREYFSPHRRLRTQGAGFRPPLPMDGAAGGCSVSYWYGPMSRSLTAVEIAQFRDRLCAAGAELFAEKGFDGFNLRDLAKRLGVSAMTPYRYFKDKDAIMSEVRARAFALFADWLESRLAAPDADETALSRACVQYAIQEPSQFRLMFGVVQPASAMRPFQVAQESRLHNIVTAHLNALVSRGRLSGDPERLGVIVWAVLHGTSALYLAGKLSGQELLHTLSDTMLLFATDSADGAYPSMNLIYGDGQALRRTS
jgi:AcrR family transcriptional regulator